MTELDSAGWMEHASLNERLVSGLFRFAFRFTGDGTSAAGVVTDVLTGAEDGTSRPTGLELFRRVWMKLQGLAAQQAPREEDKDEPEEAGAGSAAGRNWPADLTRRKSPQEVRALLANILPAIPPLDRAVLILSDIERLSRDEVGAIVRTDAPTARAILHRARLAVQQRFGYVLA